MRHVLVYPTWRCHLNCPYCNYFLQEDGLSMKYGGSGRIYKVEKELNSDELLSLLKSFNADLYEFTGGEPLRFNGIEQVLNNLPKWAITSNTLHSIEKIDFSNCLFWTASFHPHISDTGIDKFILNVKKIKRKGVTTAITLVAKPETVGKVLMWSDRFYQLDRFYQKGFGVNIHAYYEDPTFSWEKYPTEWNMLRKSSFLRYNERFFNLSGVKGSEKCCGGKDYFVIGPDGKVFRCVTDMLFHGKVLDKLSDDLYKCNQICYACCDWTHGIREEII